MTTTNKSVARLIAALALATLAACGGGSNNNSADMAMGGGGGGGGGGGDMAMETCVMSPMTSVELLNACTTAQTGDPAKDAPYYPSLAPNGNLPPLP